MQAREINLKLILDGCRRRNRNSQRKLYEYFFGYGMNVCLRYAKNRQEAEEILNNAFLKIFTNLDKYDPAYPFRTWLRRILINSAVDYFRTNQKFPVLLELKVVENLATEPFPMPELTENEDMLPVIQALPPTYRMVFNLFVMENYSHDEIGEMLGISAGTSRSNLSRAKEKLRELLTPETVKTLKMS